MDNLTEREGVNVREVDIVPAESWNGHISIFNDGSCPWLYDALFLSGERFVPKKLPLRLDIGAGSQPRGEEFTTVDKHYPADICADMWDLHMLAEGSVFEIWSSHALEHVPCGKVHQTLKEWLRVLRPNGRAIIQVPNFDYVAKYWLTGADRGWAEKMVYGLQVREGEYHNCAFTGATLKADLEAAGFKVMRVEMRWTHNQETLQAVARKPLETETKAV